MRSAWLKLLVASALLIPSVSWSYDFVPTSLEFAAWPKYCQARYVETMIGRSSEFTVAVPPAARRAAEASIGSDTYAPVHHHCAGLAYLARAKIERDPRARKHMLIRARDESNYTLRSVKPSSPLFTSIHANLARVEQALGNIEGAEEYYNRAMQALPLDPLPYIGLAILQRDTKRLSLARETLEKGLAATEGKSLEIHYNLGLICFELKDNDCAQQHAQVAYDGGYPLPGLKRKLAERGLMQ